MATRQRFGLALTAAAPNWSNGVDHILRSQSPSRGGNGTARRQSTLAGDDLFARCENRRASRAMDGAVHAASAHEGRVRGVDDGIADLARDVARTLDDQHAVG